MEKPNYYAILSAEVRYDNNLRPNTKLLYAEITALSNITGECFASNRYFSNLYNKSKGAISGWISELVKHGYIQIRYTYKEGTKEIEHRYIKIIKGGVNEKDIPPLKKTLKDNTKITNTKITNKYFKKPTEAEIIFYCVERSNNVIAAEFYDFYESKGWKVGKNKMKDWRAAVRTWETRSYKKKKMSKLDAQLSQYEQAKKLL